MLRRTVGSLVVAGLVVSTNAAAQQVTAGQNISITLHGIFSGSVFAQDADFGTGNGQKAEYVTAERDKWVHGGDVRNMRLTLGIAGPEVRPGWHANGTFEMDFFGTFVGTGNFADEQPQPRLRLAYVDLAGARTTLRVGQDWAPLLGNIPQSTSHVGFPLGWGSGGFVGWRFIQVKLIHTLSRAGAAATKKVQLALMNGSWTDEAGGADNTFSAGERAGPQLEGRFDYTTAKWGAYLVGHVDNKVIPGGNISSWAAEAGASTTRGDLSLAANAYVGKAMAPQFAQIVQFGDLRGWGAWGQLGYNLNPRWSLWGFYGTERPNVNDITNNAVTDASGAAIPLAARRFKSWLSAPMLRYKSGPYALGFEWLHSDVQVGPTANAKTRSGNQVVLSARLDF